MAKGSLPRQDPASAVAPPAEARYYACPGNLQPWGTAHAFPVWLEVQHSRAGRVRSTYIWCKVCGWRGFFYGHFWLANGVTRAWLATHCPAAVDGAGLPINPPRFV